MTAERQAVSPSPLDTFMRFADDARIRFLIGGAERILAQVPVEYLPGAKESYLEARRDGYVPITVSNHQVHLDALKIAGVTAELARLEVTHEIPSPTKGSLLPLAKSVDTGYQGELLQKGFDVMKPAFQRLGTETLLYVREEDEKRYGLVSNWREIMERMDEGIREGYGISLFPEGVVQAGRRKLKEGISPAFGVVEKLLEDIGIVEGDINGMQPFDTRDLRFVKIRVERNRRKAAFTPVAINGVYLLLRPTYEHTAVVTLRGVRAVLIPIPFGDVTVRVGVTETSESVEEAMQKNGETLGDHIGIQIARMLPEKARGVYAPAA